MKPIVQEHTSTKRCEHCLERPQAYLVIVAGREVALCVACTTDLQGALGNALAHGKRRK